MADNVWKSGAGVALRKRFRQQCEEVNAPCWICGQPIDYSAAGGHSNSFEADHFFPRVDYPDLILEESNLRPSHMSCNRHRGSRGVVIPLGPTTIDW